MNTVEKGRKGEDHAVLYLENEGYTIIRRNFKASDGEIDIIAEDEREVVFIEVKNWTTYSFDSLEYAVSRKKRRRIIHTTKAFIERNKRYEGRRIRFDVLYLNVPVHNIEHLKDVFTETGAL